MMGFGNLMEREPDSIDCVVSKPASIGKVREAISAVAVPS